MSSHTLTAPTGAPLLQAARDDRTDLENSPVRPEWVIEGSPKAAVLGLTQAEGISSGLWECTSGRFHWYYGSNEIIHILEGEAHLTDDHGNAFTLVPGSVVHFSPGTHMVWEVPEYVKKFFVDNPVPGDPLSRGVRALRRLAIRLLRR